MRGRGRERARAGNRRTGNRRNSCLTDISPVIPKVLYISLPPFPPSLFLLSVPSHYTLAQLLLCYSFSLSLSLDVSAVEVGSADKGNVDDVVIFIPVGTLTEALACPF